jgi:hypothetical protein
MTVLHLHSRLHNPGPQFAGWLRLPASSSPESVFTARRRLLLNAAEKLAVCGLDQPTTAGAAVQRPDTEMLKAIMSFAAPRCGVGFNSRDSAGTVMQFPVL